MGAHTIEIIVKGTDHASGPLGGVTTTLGRIAEIATGGLLANGLISLGEKVIGVGTKAVTMAADFETGMNILQATSGATDTQIAALSQKAKELGADITLPKTSSVDAAAAMLEMAKAGLSVNDVMSGSRGVLQLAAAGNLSEAQAAEIATNALNAFGLSGDKATKIADLLSAAANKSSVEVKDVGDSFKMSAAVFSAFQGPAVGAENAMVDLTTAIAILGNAGIKGSDAGTSLKQMMLQLTGPSMKSKDAMLALAFASNGVQLSQEQLNTVLNGGKKDREGLLADLQAANPALKNMGDIAFDGAGKMRPMNEIVGMVTKATAGMSDEMRNGFLTQIFGADATRAIITLMNAQGEQAKATGKDWDTMRAAVDKSGAANELAAARMKGMNGAVENFKSQVETMLQAAGEPFLGFISNLMTGAANVVPMIAPLVVMLSTSLVAALTSAGEWVNYLITLFQANWPTILAVVTPVMEGVGTMISTRMAAIQAVVGAVLAVVVEFWNKYGADIVAFVTTTWTQVSDIITTVSAIINQILNTIAGYIRTHGTTIQLIISGVWNVISGIITGVLALIRGIVKGVLQAINGDTKGLTETMRTMWTDVWGAIVKIIQGALQLIVGVLKLAMDFIVAVIKARVEMWRTTFAASLELIANLFGTTWDAIKLKVTTAMAAIGLAISTKWGEVQLFFATAWAAISLTFTTTLTAIALAISTKFIEIQLTLTTALAAIALAISTKWTEIRTNIGIALAVLVTLIRQKWQEIKTTIDTVLIAIKLIVTQWWDAVKLAFVEAFKALLKIIEDWFANLKTWFTERVQDFYNMGDQLIKGLANGINAGLQFVIDAVKGVLQSAIDAGKRLLGISSPSRVFKQIGDQMMQGMAIGVENGAGRALAAVTSAAGAMTNVPFGVTGSFSGVGNSMARGGFASPVFAAQTSAPVINIYAQNKMTDIEQQALAREVARVLRGRGG